MRTTAFASATVGRKEAIARWLATGLLALGLGAMSAAAAHAAETPRQATPPSGPPASGLRVQLHGDRLSVEAADQPLALVLREVTTQTGAVFHLGSAVASRVTVAFNDAPIADGLRRLLGSDTSFILYYRDASSALPNGIRLFGPDRPAESHPRPVSGAASLAERDALQTGPAGEDRRVGAGVPAAPRNGDFEISRPATTGLGLAGDDSAVEALQQLLASGPEPQERSSAAVALANIGSPRALMALRGVLDDPDTAVRTHAVYALAMQGGDDAIALLREAKRDPDVGIQRFATRAIRALENREGAPRGASLAVPIEQNGARENGANTPSVSLGQTRR
jgi:HEAT repeat protein